jgi:HK97 family phage major capsid protein
MAKNSPVSTDALTVKYSNRVADLHAALLLELKDELKTLSKPDDSGPALVSSYGSAGRTAPAWERAYRSQPWSDEERRWRTPAHDLEAVQFIRAVATNDQAMLREIDARPHNRAAAAEWQRADLAIGSIASPGTGFGTVPVGFANAIEIIMARAARMRKYVKVLPASEFGLKIPRQTTKTVAAKHAEAGDMTSGVTSPVYGSVTPEAVKLGAVVKFSRELLDDSPLQLVSAVAQDVGEAIGTLEDSAILDGTVFTNSLFDTLTPHGTITWTDASESLATLQGKYYALGGVFRSRSTWVINEAAAEAISAISGSGARQVFTEFNATPTAIDDVEGQTGVLIGRPVLVFATGTGGVPANEGFFGDLSGYALAVREQLRAEVSADSSFLTDQIALKVARREQGIVTQAGRMIHFG